MSPRHAVAMGSIGLVFAFVLPALVAGVIAGSLTGRRLLYAIGLLAAIAWYPLYADKGGRRTGGPRVRGARAPRAGDGRPHRARQRRE